MSDDIRAVIAKATSDLSNQLFSIIYVLGASIALGMNWANGDVNWLGACFRAALSWVNVGFLIAKHLSH